MSYILGDITLPNPKGFERETIEKGITLETLDGTTKKDIIQRKERYYLNYEQLTQTEIANILSEYNLKTIRNFTVAEANLTITSTPVHIDIMRRAYNTPGNEYREDIVLILTEKK